MVSEVLRKKFADWEWKCQDCNHLWRTPSYQCPQCKSLNTERTFNEFPPPEQFR